MKCSNCSKEIDESRFPSGLAFCPYCGESMVEPNQDEPRISFCPYCGGQLTTSTAFCPHCGKQLPQTPEAEHEHEQTAHNPKSHILADSKEFIGHTADVFKKTFGQERKTRNLYKQWAEHSELPIEEIAALEETARYAPIDRHLTQEMGQPERRQIPVLYVVLALAVLIILTGIILLVAQTC